MGTGPKTITANLDGCGGWVTMYLCVSCPSYRDSSPDAIYANACQSAAVAVGKSSLNHPTTRIYTLTGDTAERIEALPHGRNWVFCLHQLPHRNDRTCLLAGPSSGQSCGPMIATASTVRIVLEARVGIPVAESNAKIRRNVALISIDVRAAHGNFDVCMRPLKKLGRLRAGTSSFASALCHGAYRC